MGLIIDTSALVALERRDADPARHLGYRVLVGDRDEEHFRRVRGLEVVVVTA